MNIPTVNTSLPSDWGGMVAQAKPYPPQKLGYIVVDGVQGLSYSKLNTLHTCPRKFQLAEIGGARSFNPTAHTAFGHAYGAGVQTYLQYASLDGSPSGLEKAQNAAICSTLAAWDMYDLEETDKTRIKGFYDAVRGVRIFFADAEAILVDYKMHMFNGTKPAVELLVYIDVTDNYSYQMHIDAILECRATGQLCVLEVKTGSKPFERGDYENSSQTMGYCVALQAAFGADNVEHRTLYVCYDAKNLHTHIFEFSRGLDIGMEWAATLLMDINTLDMYEEHAMFPRRGNNCKQFMRLCEHFGTCNLAVRASVDSAYTGLPITAADIHITSEQLLALM